MNRETNTHILGVNSCTLCYSVYSLVFTLVSVVYFSISMTNRIPQVRTHTHANQRNWHFSYRLTASSFTPIPYTDSFINSLCIVGQHKLAAQQQHNGYTLAHFDNFDLWLGIAWFGFNQSLAEIGIYGHAEAYKGRHFNQNWLIKSIWCASIDWIRPFISACDRLKPKRSIFWAQINSISVSSIICATVNE